MIKRILYLLTAVLAAGILLTGCSKEKTDNTDNAAPDVVTDAPAPDGSSSDTPEVTDAPDTAQTAYAPDWTADAVIYEVNVRQFSASSSFTAVDEQLETLKEMGINTLWFMPIFPISRTNRSGTLGSYYSVDNYTKVNPEFGTIDDFRALADHAHELGFHIVLDWVANHTGWDNPWIKDHPDWYTQKDGKIISPEGFNWPDVADLNYDNQEMRRAMIDAMAYWVSEFDVDGFRCDYAGGVPADFWAEARSELEKIKPVFFLEEELGGQNQKLLEEAFDCNYAAKFYDTLVLVASGAKTPDKLKLYLQKMPENDFPMFYLDNHDVNSYDRTIIQGFTNEKLPAMFGVIFTMPGMPMIYTGDEIGYDHRLAFMEKDPVKWTEGTGDYRPLIRILSDIKKDNPALFAGRFGGELEYLDAGKSSIFAYRRSVDGNSVVCVFNLSKNEQEADWQTAGITGGTVLLTGRDGEWNSEEAAFEAPQTLAPWEFYIIKE